MKMYRASQHEKRSHCKSDVSISRFRIILPKVLSVFVALMFTFDINQMVVLLFPEDITKGTVITGK